MGIYRVDYSGMVILHIPPIILGRSSGPLGTFIVLKSILYLDVDRIDNIFLLNVSLYVLGLSSVKRFPD